MDSQQDRDRHDLLALICVDLIGLLLLAIGLATAPHPVAWVALGCSIALMLPSVIVTRRWRKRVNNTKGRQ